jgi:hypothetical protein
LRKIIVMIFLAAVTEAAAFGQDGVIRALTGDVELKHPGTSVYVSASEGDTVASSTIISTGFRSTATIAVGSSVITVQPITRLSFVEIITRGNTENVRVNLQAGRVKVDVKPPAGTKTNLSVQSPAAVASVRGTNFEMDSETLIVSEGRIIYNGTAGPAVIVTGGNSSYIHIDGTTVNPLEVVEGSFAPVSPIGAPSSDAAPPVTTNNGVTVTAGYSNDN